MKPDTSLQGKTNLNIALEKAMEQFSAKDPEEMAGLSGALFEPVNRINALLSCRFAGNDYTVSYPEGLIEGAGGTTPTITLRILILHYLANASGKPLTGRLVSYKDLRGGEIYFPAFRKRVEQPVVNAHGLSPDGFAEACRSMDGVPVQYGDISFTLPVLPMIPVTYILWMADSEFEAAVQVLFDEVIADYLHIEDIAVLAETISWMLARYKRQY